MLDEIERGYADPEPRCSIAWPDWNASAELMDGVCLQPRRNFTCGLRGLDAIDASIQRSYGTTRRAERPPPSGLPSPKTVRLTTRPAASTSNVMSSFPAL